jgi:hypothetical protein
MTITLNVQNEQLFDKVLWLLNHLKNDGLEIITSRTKKRNTIKPSSTSKQKELPSGFLNPITINSYSDIATRDEIYER